MWKKCSSCKNAIDFGARYYVCSVSTCNGQRTGYVFCSVPCFERHLPGARHKDAAAVEERAPAASAGPTSAATPTAVRRIVPSGSPPNKGTSESKEVLIIASRLKEYVQNRSDFNTSANVMDVLSDHVRIICDRAIDNARAEGRMTLMDRDFSFLKK